MKARIASFVMLLCPLVAVASGWTSISGTNKYGEKVTWQADPVELGNINGVVRLAATISVEKEDGSYSEYANQECEFSGGGDKKFFACSGHGKSPLAGATYLIRPDNTKECGGTFYYLKRGGSKHTPRIMYQDPWEC